MGKASFWSTYQCDRCGRLDHNPAGPHLPEGWRSHQKTGETLCPACVEKDVEERRA
jgi:DNA-directed RNA polymerase subunit RPC12/RpoP